MHKLGKTLCLLVFALMATQGQAEVRATIDRQNVSLGDTLRLTITATGDEKISDTDLRALLVDFEILQRSTSSNTSITNGRRTHSRQILLDITPRRQGALEIPPLRVGRGTSNSLSVNVGPPASGASAQDTVLFEAEIDSDKVYVQGQVILTLRVQRAINLDNLAISEISLEDAFIKQLEQKSFQRNIDGRPWLVHEIRYAIFPAYSGKLEIPAQTFSARESRPRQSFFDLNSGGKLLRRNSQPLTIEVLPRPASYGTETWLPARLVSIEEDWSTPPEQLRAGDSTTRTITLRGEGLQGAQLPPVIFEPVEGLKYYPDQPVINDSEIGSGLLGSRQDSAAMVPTRAGSWVIPEIRIPWWDTESGRMRYVEIPERRIEVGAAEVVANNSTAVVPALNTPIPTIAMSPVQLQSNPDSRIWQAIAALTSAGWLLTLWLTWRGRRKGAAPAGDRSAGGDDARAYKQLLAACAANSAEPARTALIDWSGALHPTERVLSLDQVGQVFDDRLLDQELTALNRALFSKPGETWQGDGLADIVRRLRQQKSNHSEPETHGLELYPT